ncbi:CTIF factor, partial [Cardinalis cardinalis]|nr:CTIF factor [Cardinalis cardinalis]
MESSSVASASSEAGSSRSQEIEELERFIDSYVLEYQVQGLLTDKTEGDGESEKTQSHVSQWTADCSEQLDGSCSPSRGKGSSSHEHNQNGNKESNLDMLGTDIWAANTFDSFSGATWDLQPEKLDFTQFHRKLRNTSKHPLPHIDREGLGKGKYEDGDSINLNDIEKVLPVWQGYHSLPHEAQIVHTKKLFRRRRNDRREFFSHLWLSPGIQRVLDALGEETLRAFCLKPHAQGCDEPWSCVLVLPSHPKILPAGRMGGNRQMCVSVPFFCLVPSDKPSADRSIQSSRASLPPAQMARRDSRRNCLGLGPKINLLQSSKDRLRRRLKEKVLFLRLLFFSGAGRWRFSTPCLSLFTDQDEVTVETTDPEKNKMDKLIEILNSMRNNSSDVDSKLTTFMEEAQNSTNSEEMLGEIVKTIYQKAVTDRSFASTAAKLCDKMALFMVEGTKFRSLLLNMLQKDFSMREELQQRDVERWLGFITFLCEVFGTMRSSTGEPFRVLVCPIYTCLRELLQSQDVKEDAVLCCSMELQSSGRLLEEQLPEMMTELLAIARDKMLCPSESMLTRSLLLEVIELHANNWNPLTPTITQYYNKTIQKLTA